MVGLQNYMWNKIIVRQYDIFKKLNAFSKDNAVSLSEIGPGLAILQSSVCTVYENKAFIDPIKIKKDIKSLMRFVYIFSILIPIFIYIYIRLYRMESYSSGTDVLILAIVAFLLFIGIGYVEFKLPFRKFGKNIYINEKGECNYHEGPPLSNEQEL